ncbi:MAG: hypothetical protein COA43_13635 [Robiginitomaculum sp.]|nr:MAG: hypothetical protein COA43_13635 [Robiginitomaculum sp.]
MTTVFDKNAINAENIVDYIASIFERRGAESYLGEQVSMAQHMLQSAQAAEMAKAITDNKEWRESRPAQKTAKREDLVATIKDMLV